MRNPEEKWEAQVNGEIYDSTFAELTVWIAESSLLETDKVRRENLRWLEAGKVPALRDFFNAKTKGVEPPHVHLTDSSAIPFTGDVKVLEEEEINVPVDSVETIRNLSNNQIHEKVIDANEPELEVKVCNIHPELLADFVCETCFHHFCNECPQGFGTSVRICPYCGALCREINYFNETNEKELNYQRDLSEGFGFSDFGKALSYPFKFKTSLFFGGLFMAFFTIGQNAVSMGNIIFVASALICYMFANALTFGVLANTVENFSQGYKERDFMSGFDDFSLWDDVVHPFFLSIGVWISSFGPLILIIVLTFWFAIGSATSALNQQIKNPQLNPSQPVQTSKKITEILDKYKKQNQGRPGIEVGEDGLTIGQRMNLEEEAEFEELNELANNYRKGQLEGTFGKMPEEQQKDQQAMVMQFIKFAGAFLILAFIALLWGVFYFPASCAVAGYTRSFMATINPLIGLDTIKHLGIDYLKILVMSLLISLMSGIIAGTLAFILSPLDLPAFGNLPAQFIGAFATFYFSVVFAVTLGYALYKNSDKLNLTQR